MSNFIKWFFFFVCSILLMQCNKRTSDILEDLPPIEQPTKLRYLALGDSYTIGQSVATTDRYPIQLANELLRDSINIDTTYIIAKTGWRTDNLISAIESAQLPIQFDLVSLLIGVNNQYQNRPIEQYEQEFTALITTAISFADGDRTKVFVLSIPDYGYTSFGKNNQEKISLAIDQYNEINKTIASEFDVSYFDITPISRNGLAQPALIASDGLHPSGEMYRRWVELIYSDVKRKLP